MSPAFSEEVKDWANNVVREAINAVIAMSLRRGMSE